jgi:alcohol dehydrogenase/L-iditol 2-dehydrogenase
MKNEMQPAVVNYAEKAGSVDFRECAIPEIGETDVLVEVGAVGVCGSDLHQWTASHSWPVNYPVILGHEFAGTIVETGKRVDGWSTGDRVVSETAAIIDTASPLTRQGRYNLDPSRKGFGYGVDGAMTRFVRVPERCLHRIPDNLPFEKAALTEPCCVAYNAVVKNARIEPGDRILVIGPGPIGILCGAMARLCGADVAVCGLEQDRTRLKVAEAYRCRTFVDGVEDWCRERDGLGCDGVVDAAGVSASLKAAMQLVRPAGWISKVGWGPQPLNFSLDPIVQKNVTLQGSFSHNWPIWERVIALLAENKLTLDPVIGGIWNLSEWETAFKRMHSGEITKAVLQP